MASRNIITGYSQSQELSPHNYVRDIRTSEARFFDLIKNPTVSLVVCAVMTVFSFVYEQWGDVLFLIMVPIVLLNSRRYVTYELPYRVPKHAQVKDAADIDPATKKPVMARGIDYLGTDRETNLPIYLSDTDSRSHISVAGTTGGGKSETLKSMLANAIAWGNGAIFVDGKAENVMYRDIYALAKRMGREDDVLVVNFLTGNQDVLSLHGQTNTINPFVTGSSTVLAQMMIDLMADGSDGGNDSGMWKDRAEAYIKAILMYLTYKRDIGHVDLDIEVVRQSLSLKSMMNFYIKARKDGTPELIIQSLSAYFTMLPGFEEEIFFNTSHDENNPPKTSEEAEKQHSFLTMQFTGMMTTLADTYGYIFRHQLADIDVRDVVLNRRILVVMLPPLEKSRSETAALGKMVVAWVQSVMATTLGHELEGLTTEKYDAKPTNASTPFTIIFDEVGAYASKQLATIASQARSLGFKMVLGFQDEANLKEKVGDLINSILGNTVYYIVTRLVDKTTIQRVIDYAGKAFVARATNLNVVGGGGAYADNQQAHVEKLDRLDSTEIARQEPGQATIVGPLGIVRAQMLYVQPPKLKHTRFNKFIGIRTVDTRQLEKKRGRAKSLGINLLSEEFRNDLKTFNVEFTRDKKAERAARILRSSIEAPAHLKDIQALMEVGEFSLDPIPEHEQQIMDTTQPTVSMTPEDPDYDISLYAAPQMASLKNDTENSLDKLKMEISHKIDKPISTSIPKDQIADFDRQLDMLTPTPAAEKKKKAEQYIDPPNVYTESIVDVVENDEIDLSSKIDPESDLGRALRNLDNSTKTAGSLIDLSTLTVAQKAKGMPYKNHGGEKLVKRGVEDRIAEILKAGEYITGVSNTPERYKQKDEEKTDSVDP